MGSNLPYCGEGVDALNSRESGCCGSPYYSMLGTPEELGGQQLGMPAHKGPLVTFLLALA